MTKEQAIAAYRELVAKHGLQWTATSVTNPAAWKMMADVNRVLSEDDKRAALGMPRGRK